MSPRANVRSLDAVRRFRPAVIRFEDELAAALTSLRSELNRTLQWLDHDCPAYWQQQVRDGFDKVAEARTQLMRKQMMTVAGHRSDCIDEKKAMVKAKERLELAQEKVRLCRQWSIKAHRAADEYNARIGRVEQAISQGLPRILVMLEGMTRALEGYTETQKAALSETDVETAETEATAAAEPQPAAETRSTGEPVDAAQPAQSEPAAKAGGSVDAGDSAPADVNAVPTGMPETGIPS